MCKPLYDDLGFPAQAIANRYCLLINPVDMFCCRVIKLAGEDGNLTKENFVKILKTSDFFMKSFDKNKDGVVTEVNIINIIIRGR